MARAASPLAITGNNPAGTYNAWIKYRVLDEDDQPVGDEQTVYLPNDVGSRWTQLKLGVRVHVAYESLSD